MVINNNECEERVMSEGIKYDKTRGFMHNFMVFASKLCYLLTGVFIDFTTVDMNEVDDVDYSDYMKPPKDASLWEKLTWDPEEAYLRDQEFEDVHENDVLDFAEILAKKLATGDSLDQTEESI